MGHRHRWFLEDLPIFKPRASFFVVDPRYHRGINCRFGQRGIIAAAHYDGGRNFVSMMRGWKRWILLPPTECLLLYLSERGHPEARHTKVDWSVLDYRRYPLMDAARATEVVLRPGDVLYVPSYWFHVPISLDYGFTAQCNA